MIIINNFFFLINVAFKIQDDNIFLDLNRSRENAEKLLELVLNMTFIICSAIILPFIFYCLFALYSHILSRFRKITKKKPKKLSSNRNIIVSNTQPRILESKSVRFLSKIYNIFFY